MKTKILLFAAVLLSGVMQLQAQDRPAPEYLTRQDLPDSVKATQVTTTDGKTLSLGEVLKKYKGKRVVIDFWASWCKDCIQGMPKVIELQGSTNPKKVVFLMLSVDKDSEKWQSGITKFQVPGEQYRFVLDWKNPFSNYIDLDWIPRYLVLNEKGQIIVPKAIHADDPAILQALSK